MQEANKVMGDGGRVLMISGIDSIRNLPGHGVLGAAKAALESMVRDFAFELGPRGITVNGLNVGYIDTDSARFYANYLGDNYEDFKRRCAERSALKRLPTLDEIAAVACLLCMPAASYLTAQTIMVDGGFTLSFPGRSDGVPGRSAQLFSSCEVRNPWADSFISRDGGVV